MIIVTGGAGFIGSCIVRELDFDFLYRNNFEYTKTLWKFCTENHCSFLYASSAATYGAGECGFDDRMDLKKLRPLNGYGYSKQLFDLWAEKQEEAPAQHVGFKFFNVYGPNEYCKGSMASVVFHSFCKITESGGMGVFIRRRAAAAGLCICQGYMQGSAFYDGAPESEWLV